MAARLVQAALDVWSLHSWQLALRRCAQVAVLAFLVPFGWDIQLHSYITTILQPILQLTLQPILQLRFLCKTVKSG